MSDKTGKSTLQPEFVGNLQLVVAVTQCTYRRCAASHQTMNNLNHIYVEGCRVVNS